jgi:hypothetical protein
MTTNPATEPAEVVDDDGEVLTNTDSSIEWDADILVEQGDNDALVEDSSTIFDSVDAERPIDGEMNPSTKLEWSQHGRQRRLYHRWH